MFSMKGMFSGRVRHAISVLDFFMKKCELYNQYKSQEEEAKHLKYPQFSTFLKMTHLLNMTHFKGTLRHFS